MNLPFAFVFAAALLSLSMALAFWRIIHGPALPDRVIALDLITTLTVAAIIVYTIASDQRVLVDSTLGVALLAFLATVAFARYLETKARRD